MHLKQTLVILRRTASFSYCDAWHIRFQSTGFEEIHGGQAIGTRNTDGDIVLEFP